MRNFKIVLTLCSLIPLFSASADDSSWRISAGGGLTLGSTSKGDFNMSQLSNGTRLISGEIEYKEKAGLHIDLDIRKTPKNSWGGIFGLSYDFKRELKEMTIRIAGQSDTSNATGDDKIQTTSLYANAVYRWDNFYIPFGLNYTIIDLTTKDEGVDIDGGIGVQVGMGYWFTEFIVGEFFIKAFNIDMSITSQADDYKMETKDFINTSTKFSIKYIF